MFKENLKKRREELGLSQEGLANRMSGISRQAVAKWESPTGKTTFPRPELWSNIEAALKVAPGWVAEAIANEVHTDVAGKIKIKGADVAMEPVAASYTNVPVIKWSQVARWCGHMKGPSIEPYDFLKAVTIDTTLGEKSYALAIEGKAMEPEFAPGEFVIVDPNVDPTTGRYVVVIVNGEALLRRFESGGDAVYVYPSNDMFNSISIPTKQFVPCGCVRQKVKLY